MESAIYVGFKVAAKMTGLSVRYLRILVSRYHLPSFRVGRRVLLKVADLIELVERGRVRPTNSSAPEDITVHSEAPTDGNRQGGDLTS